MSLFCCDFFRTCNLIISDIFRMSIVIFAFFSEFEKEINTMTLRERIKELCKEKKVSLNKAETDCGFAKGYFSKLDKSTPNSANLQKIADYFGRNVDYLLTGEEKEITVPEQADLWIAIRKDKKLLEALEKYMSLSDKKKKHVIDTIDVLSEE